MLKVTRYQVIRRIRNWVLIMTENTNFETDLKKYSDKLDKSENGLTYNIAWLYGIFLLCIFIIVGIACYFGYQKISNRTTLISSLFELFIFLLVGLGFGHGFEYLKYKSKNTKVFKILLGLLLVAIIVSVFFPYVTSFYPEFFIALVVFIASSTFFQIHYSIQEGIERDQVFLNLLEKLHNERNSTND